MYWEFLNKLNITFHVTGGGGGEGGGEVIITLLSYSLGLVALIYHSKYTIDNY